MPNFSGFSDILKQHLPRHKARTGCPANIIIAIFVRQTVNPAGLKGLFSSKAKPESPYRRMQRFFSGNFIGKTDIARFIFALFGWQSAPPLTAPLGSTANPASTSRCRPWSGVVLPSRYCGKRLIKKAIPTQAKEPPCRIFSAGPSPTSTLKHSMRIGNSLAMNGRRICVKRGFPAASAARKMRR